MGAGRIDDKASDTLVVDSDEGFWTGSSTLPHLHHIESQNARGNAGVSRCRVASAGLYPVPILTTPVIVA